MSKKQFALWIILILILWTTCVFPIIFAYGVRTGKHQTKEWESTNVHHDLQVRGYNYCPYCGEEIKGDKK